MNKLTSEVLNRILTLFNLTWTPIGLFYIHKLRFGNVEYFITKDVNKIYEFLELPYAPYPNIDASELVYLAANSPYFNFNSFIRHKGSKQYQKFLNELKRIKPVSVYNPVYIANYGAMKADIFFGTKILNKIIKLEPIGLNNKALKNKFNGHLVQKWANISRGPLVVELMEEFKGYIEEVYGYSFLDYLTGRTPALIRLDFLNYYHKGDIKFVEDLPF